MNDVNSTRNEVAFPQRGRAINLLTDQVALPLITDRVLASSHGSSSLKSHRLQPSFSRLKKFEMVELRLRSVQFASPPSNGKCQL